MKSTTAGPKIDDLRKINENKKCFDCHEKVNFITHDLGNHLCCYGFRHFRLLHLLRFPQRDDSQGQRSNDVQLF